MPLTTILKCLPASQFPSAVARPSLWGLALIGLVLTVGSSNRSLKQAGVSVAFVAGGAAAAILIQKDERLAEIHQLQAGHKRREAALKTSLDIAMADSEALAAQVAQMNAVLGDWQTARVLIAGQLATLENEQRQLLCELYETAVTEAMLHAKITEVETCVTNLEAALTAKTNLATQMLTELEAEATGTFTHFTAKVNAQSQLINDLHQQIGELRQRNAALTNKTRADQPFENVRPNNFMGNRLLDYLAKN